MRLPPASDSSVKDMILGVEITIIALTLPDIIGDVIILAGIWITISGYYSEKGTGVE